MKSNIRRSPLLTLAFSLICPTLTAAAQTSLRREVGARRRLPSVSRLRNLVPEVLQPAEQMFCYRCGRPVSPRSQRTVTAQRWPEADLNSPASPFPRRPRHFPANIATLYSYPENAAPEKTEWRWMQSQANRSLAAISLQTGKLAGKSQNLRRCPGLKSADKQQIILRLWPAVGLRVEKQNRE
jgi:hypothetical protein